MTTPATFGPQRNGSALVFDFQFFVGTIPPAEEGTGTRSRGAPALRPMRDAVARVTASQRRARPVRIVATATDTTVVHPDFQVRLSGAAVIRNPGKTRARVGRVQASGVVNPTDEEILQLVVKMSQSAGRGAKNTA